MTKQGTSSAGGAVRVRFAPSPTGYIHMGNIRSALFNYVFARATEGSFVLRVEDTDLERHVAGSDRDLIEVLSWLGLSWNEGPRVGGRCGPYYQTERLDSYRRHAATLIEGGLAYYDFEAAPDQEASPAAQSYEIQWESPSAQLDPADARARVAAGEPHAIRMRISDELYPGRVVSFEDMIHGRVEKECEDFVIVKRNGIPTYHFAVVCDDVAMEISHVIRGIGHLDNTVKHVVLYEAFGWDKPRWAHHSHTKGLSKRKGSPSVGDLMRRGYLPEAIGNACMLMGWFPKDQNELFCFEERIPEFRLEDLNTGMAGAFDEDKFRHICQHHMTRIDPGRLLNLARPFLEATGFIAEGEGRAPTDPARVRLLKIMECVRSRIACAAEVLDHLPAFRSPLELEPEAREQISGEGPRLALEVTREHFADASQESLSAAEFGALSKAASKDARLKERKIKGKGYFQPLRAALTGRTRGLELGSMAEILGRAELLARLDAALALSAASLGPSGEA